MKCPLQLLKGQLRSTQHCCFSHIGGHILPPHYQGIAVSILNLKVWEVKKKYQKKKYQSPDLSVLIQLATVRKKKQ